VTYVAKRKKQPDYAIDPTPTALAVGIFGGAAALYLTEVIYSEMRDSGGPDIPGLPNWRAHMGAVCVGSIAFVVTFFLMESLGRKSKVIAWRSSIPWLPLIALTAVATAIHIPIYVVIVSGTLYSVWAYRRTRAIR